MPRLAAIHLPEGWCEGVNTAFLSAVGLASYALSYARGRTTSRRRLQAQLEQAETEIALLREELAIKDRRWHRSTSRRRRHYTPVQGMRILQLRVSGSVAQRDRVTADFGLTSLGRRVPTHSPLPLDRVVTVNDALPGLLALPLSRSAHSAISNSAAAISSFGHNSSATYGPCSVARNCPSDPTKNL